MKQIGIVGSINTDLVCTTQTLPKVGETVVGTQCIISQGGKGANEAVACARLGAKVALFGCVGDDLFSNDAINNLKNENVNLNAVEQIKGAKCGVANIVVCNKNNQIIVVPGANNLVNKSYIQKHCETLKQCNIVGTQFEVGLDAVIYASQICKENNISFVLNPSPIKDYPKELLNNSTFVIVNEIEIAEVEGYNNIEPLNVLSLYPNKLILTKGGDGAFYCDGKDIINVPAIKVKPVDTTGAGDTFLGAFMVAINNNLNLHDTITFANICAGLKTTKLGAQTAMPTVDEVKHYIDENNINFKNGEIF